MFSRGETPGDVGYGELLAALGNRIPTGLGIRAIQTEAWDNGNYFPNPMVMGFEGKTFIDKTGASSGYSSHATAVAGWLVGNNGMAPGVNQIDVYEADWWITGDYLNAVSPWAPKVETNGVLNASWIGYTDNPADSLDILRRVDWAIDRDGFTAVVGVNNGSGTSVPYLLADAYNVIAVGLSNGNSSFGPSTLDTTGRSTPTIVAPMEFVSNATPIVGAAVLMLKQMTAPYPNADRPETLKAVLVAGASKAPFDLHQSTPQTTDDWSHTTTRPLDVRFGAGQLEVFNSYNILAAGQQPANAASDVRATGWDHRTITNAQSARYDFDILSGQTAQSFSIAAVWNRHVDGAPDPVDPINNPLVLTPSVAVMGLSLYQANGQTLGPLVAQSVSPIDNLQHIYVENLPAGHYAIQLTTDRPWDYSIAWQARISGPPAYLNVVNGADSTVVQLANNASSAAIADGANGVLTPLGIAADAAGNRYVADPFGSRVMKIDLSGNAFVAADSAQGVVFPTGVLMNPDGSLLVANYSLRQLVRVDAAGNATIFSDTSKGLGQPLGMARAANGDVFVADPIARTIFRVDAAGHASTFVGPTAGLLSPFSLAFGPDGKLYVADPLLEAIVAFDPAGNPSVFADYTDGLTFPTGLAFDSSGRLLVADYPTDRIFRFDAAGNGSIFATGANGVHRPIFLIASPAVLTAADRFAIAAVPEASSAWLLTIAVAGFALCKWRSRG